MADRKQYTFWELKRTPVPFVCQGCGNKTLQLDHFERVKKFCSRACVGKAQRAGTFPLPDQKKNKPESLEKRLANLKLGPKASAAKALEYEYTWKICKECKEEFPSSSGPSTNNPAQYCSNVCHQRSWQRRHRPSP